MFLSTIGAWDSRKLTFDSVWILIITWTPYRPVYTRLESSGEGLVPACNFPQFHCRKLCGNVSFLVLRSSDATGCSWCSVLIKTVSPLNSWRWKSAAWGKSWFVIYPRVLFSTRPSYCSSRFGLKLHFTRLAIAGENFYVRLFSFPLNSRYSSLILRYNFAYSYKNWEFKRNQYNF